MDPELVALCRRILGREPAQVERFRQGPGGAERGTVRVVVGGRSVYATRRQNPEVTEREARILRDLKAQGAPVPRVLAFEDGWLLVESAGDERLAQSLARLSAREGTTLLRRAIDALEVIHRAGQIAQLDRVVPQYAHGPETARHLLHTLEAIGTLQGVELPEFDGPGVAALLARPGDAFIKWDARAANAAAGPDGAVRWFDWQHANRRHRADDLVWLLCDEFVPEELDPAERLASLARAWEGDATRAVVQGCAHVGVRLRGILTGGPGLDASFEACLAEDWLGSRASALRLCRRGAALAREAEIVRPLVDWYQRLEISLRA